MDKKEIRKAVNQLGRVKKSTALDSIDKKTIEKIRKKLYNKIKEAEAVKKFENLALVHYDEASDLYTLEFQENGASEFINVKASDHPEAATDEHYFDDKNIIEKIILENE